MCATRSIQRLIPIRLTILIGLLAHPDAHPDVLTLDTTPLGAMQVNPDTLALTGATVAFTTFTYHLT